ncbi:putative ABC transport system ATP-binding protein [Actinomadura luteofluorescens]|uniref:Putative ABC transport system ATP-binding protein n=1 Tax=Actinomadura luteofluorescens TaxID=46163 RepID=A0A7Y9JHI1_9ACTN|nr:ABC transporter ATP-binding protein [Actinomadura luteofluorescens]NYD47364.1 putative ABC transport system ATP-binding protein [Actinomadura luteofluorescens]
MVVRLDNVVRRYGAGQAEVAALDGVSLDFGRGTFTAIMGPSGSGKSTLLHCAAGLDRVDEGQVLLAGQDPSRLPRRTLTELRRDHTGFVFQAFNLIPTLTAKQNVELPVRLAGRVPDPDQVARSLDRVGLADRAHHLPTQLSGGQQQRVAVARALVARPRVLFADEPTGALDIRSSREVLRLLRDTVAQSGTAVIMVTHDPVAAAHAQRVAFLADGRLVGELAGASAEKIAARMTLLESGRWADGQGGHEPARSDAMGAIGARD